MVLSSEISVYEHIVANPILSVYVHLSILGDLCQSHKERKSCLMLKRASGHSAASGHAVSLPNLHGLSVAALLADS